MEINDYVFRFNNDFYEAITEGIKTSTIRNKTKPVKIGDICYAYFPKIKKVTLIEIMNHYARKVIDLTMMESEREGYLHPCLLKHELKSIYHDLDEDDYVYVYHFKEWNKTTKSKRLCDEFLAKVKEGVSDE